MNAVRASNAKDRGLLLSEVPTKFMKNNGSEEEFHLTIKSKP